jgi:hypothetical protein
MKLTNNGLLLWILDWVRLVVALVLLAFFSYADSDEDTVSDSTGDPRQLRS